MSYLLQVVKEILSENQVRQEPQDIEAVHRLKFVSDDAAMDQAEVNNTVDLIVIYAPPAPP